MLTVQMLAFAVAGLALGGGFAFLELRLLIFGTVGIGFALTLVFVRQMLTRGRVADAITTLAIAFYATVFSLLVAYPTIWPALAFVPVLVIALAASSASTEAMRRIAVASWATTATIVLLGMTLPSESQLPPWFESSMVFASVAGTSAASYGLLHISTKRLQDAIEHARAAQTDLEHANERLRGLDELKTQLMNNVAHELATPLTPITLQLNMLQRRAAGVDDPKMHTTIAILTRNIDRLQMLVKDALDVAKLQAGRLTVQREVVRLDELAKEAVETMDAAARDKQISLQLHMEPRVHVFADPLRLSQIMYVMIDNAIKFTPKDGSITVEALHEGDRCVFRVQDTGIGIDLDRLDELFEPFSQTHDTMQVKEAGAGLSLYIAKGIVEMLGGRVWAGSGGPDQGSTFGFELDTVMEGRGSSGLPWYRKADGSQKDVRILDAEGGEEAAEEAPGPDGDTTPLPPLQRLSALVRRTLPADDEGRDENPVGAT